MFILNGKNKRMYRKPVFIYHNNIYMLYIGIYNIYNTWCQRKKERKIERKIEKQEGRKGIKASCQAINP